jgi:hypothetical protein
MRTTIHLPDELVALLEPYREEINVSSVCAAALRQKIEQIKLLEAGKHDREALLERLRQEKLTAHAEDELAGRMQATRDVRTMEYTRLREYGYHDLSKPTRQRYFDMLPVDIQDGFYSEHVDPEMPYVDPEAWALGWLSQVQEWWKQISKEL